MVVGVRRRRRRVIGGTLGGQVGGQIGGTGDTPQRVGGDVKAPTTISRVDPQYTELARKARVEGIVILEAIIDRNGNVTDARVLKPLPLGLDQAALEAVKREVQYRYAERVPFGHIKPAALSVGNDGSNCRRRCMEGIVSAS